jgi:hypothetical protein
MALAGGVATIVGAMSLGGGDPGGVTFVAMGMAMIVVASLRAPARTDALPAAAPVVPGESGLVFRYSERRARRAAVAIALFMVAAAAMAIWPETFSGRRERVARPAGIVAAVAAAATLGSGVGGRPGAAVVLTPARIAHETGRFKTAVRWESVADVRAASGYGGEPVVAVDATDARAVEASAAARIVTPFVRWSVGHVALHPQALEVEPAALLLVVRHYWQHPEDRAELGTQRAVERYRESVRASRPPAART